MRIVKSEDFENTIFEDEDEFITLVIASKWITWTTPKNHRRQLEQHRAWENSEEYKKLEYERWFGKDDTNRD